MKYAMDETERRRRKQTLFNKKNKISPQTIKNKISDIVGDLEEKNENDKINKYNTNKKSLKENIENLKKEMENAAINLEFEKAAKIRDEIKFLQSKELGLLSIIKK